MSSYSFSPQFYQRWTCAPDPIRASIIQELTDITTLLQHETPFETFVFSTHDLDAHLDDLYENHDAEQAIAKAIEDKQAQARAAAEKEHLEEQQKTQAAEDAKNKEAKLKEAKLKEAEAAQKEQQHNEQLANNKSASINDNDISKNVTSKNDTSKVEKSVTDSRVENHQGIETSDAKLDVTKTAADTDTDKRSIHEPTNAVNAVNDNNMKTVIDKAVADAGIHLSLKDAKLGATPPELIRELEIQIDDYLSEQMMLMSENLKSWLRAEVTQHLSAQDKTLTNDSNKIDQDNNAKKNIH